MTKHLAIIGMALMLPTAVQACSWLSPCKPQVTSHAKPKNAALEEQEARIAKLEAENKLLKPQVDGLAMILRADHAELAKIRAAH